ncbi:hypothetical protein [Sphingomonas quercus]|uniref:Lipoprotein n=1 Tax=Sphingomonas quercus TaxID=2842451 RepID=A0ABS6BEQ2_9SPHN|nr:hypothetical protein [Sphingomonas quercus]MBU3076787.1 hypothetical protein [Sphingomonas quercus]
MAEAIGNNALSLCNYALIACGGSGGRRAPSWPASDHRLGALNVPLILLVALLLAGCATTPPAVEIRTVHVDRPIAVPCIAGPLPDKPASGLDRVTGLPTHDLDIVGAAYLRIDAHADELRALAAACTTTKAAD